MIDDKIKGAEKENLPVLDTATLQDFLCHFDF